VQFDPEKFSQSIVSMFQAHLAKEIAPLRAQLAAFEAREPLAGKDGVGLSKSFIDKDGQLVLTKTNGEADVLGVVVGKDGETPDMSGLKSDIESQQKAVEQNLLKAQKAAKSDTQNLDVKIDSTEMVKAIEEAIAALEIEPGEKGDAGPKGDQGPQGEKGVEGQKGKAGPKGEPGETGLQGDAGAAGEKGDAGKDGKAGPAGEKGESGKDGLGFKSAIQNADGELILIDDNGEEKAVGNVRGKDGSDGKDGEKGADGKDGIGFDEVAMEKTGDRDFSFLVKSNDGREKRFDFNLPVAIYRGLYDEGAKYSQGDMVTRGGSIWHCEVSKTKEHPGGEVKSEDWSLAVKAGRTGKDGKDGAKGADGIQGPRGRSYGESYGD